MGKYIRLLLLVFAADCAGSAAEQRPDAQPLSAAPATSATAASASGEFIPSAQARDLVFKGAALIDVRTPAEYAEKHVEGAKNIPVQELPARLAEVGPKDVPVVVYCRSGKRSTKAADILRAEGYTVYNLGSVDNW